MPLFQIFRGYPDFDMMHLEHMRDVMKRSRELLANMPIPNTFAGRKTQEPFPQEAEDALVDKLTVSKELQRPE